MSGVEDAERARSYIVEHAQELNIDPEAIGMGGHSARAGITASVALGRDTPLKAIFPLSPPNTFFDPDFIIGRQDLPAVLMHFSQYDDEAVLRHAPTFSTMLRAAGTEFTLGWIPGFMHFYPHNAPSLADDGTRISLGDRVLAFFGKTPNKIRDVFPLYDAWQSGEPKYATYIACPARRDITI